MYKSLFLNKLIATLWFLLAYAILIPAQQDLFHSRTLDLEEILSEGLYSTALTSIDPYSDMASVFELDRANIISLLNTRYPDLGYQLERTPKQALNGQEVAAIMVQILKEESAAGVVDAGDTFWKITEESEMNSADRAVFKFLYAYELFKQKRFNEADKIFNKILESRKGEYEYAFYYSGLINLMKKDYDNASDKLKRIGNNERLRLHTPYYLAAAHYGKRDYNTIIKFYEPRISDSDLHNIAGITKLVAFAQFNTKDYEGAITTLSRLEKARPLSSDENYVLGIAYQQSGNGQKSTNYLSEVDTDNESFGSKAKYQKALNLAHQQKTKESLALFEELLKNDEFDRNEIIWNLAILNGRIKNYDKMAFHASQLFESPKKEMAVKLVVNHIDNLDNDELYVALVIKIHPILEDKAALNISVYEHGLLALKSNDKIKANKFFNLLSEIDPLVEERGAVAAWRGIMAYEEGNYARAIRLLSNYKSSRAVGHKITKLDFDADYFLAYSNFKTKNHGTALGHYSKALETAIKNTDVIITNRDKITNDLFLRLGDCYFLLDEYESAERAYTNVIERNGASKDYALWQNSIIAELNGKPYDQIIILDEIISDYPASRYYNRSIFSTANALFSINRYDKASKYYNRIINSNFPERLQEESIVQMGLISVNAGDYKTAEGYFKKLIDNSQNNDIVQRSHIALQEIYADYTYDTEAYLDLIAKDDSAEFSSLSKALYDLALNNFEKGNIEEAIDQWNKLLNDFPESDHTIDTYKNLGIAYEQRSMWAEAMKAYKESAIRSKKKDDLALIVKSEDIALYKLKDYKQFLAIRKERKRSYPSSALSTDEKYNESIAYLNIKELELATAHLVDIFSDLEFEHSKKISLLSDISIQLNKNKNWTTLIDVYNQKEVKHFINKKPKLIYQRALAYFNNNQLEEASVSITDHYDTLLENPAWLAKGIILIADIYILQDEKDSAEAALEALIASESNVPPGLISIARERLKSLELQN